ncbi:MAG: AraC family transcriptional regulator, partial [Prevotellaceae bacterium]|nr:AraC family transcriptional regulator [Prevotellaceae bacterium]
MDRHKTLKHIKTVSEFHQLRGLPKPEHPLISIVDFKTAPPPSEDIKGESWMLNFYCIAIKRGLKGKIKYGHQTYDFDEGVMSFSAPNQVLGIEADATQDFKPASGWMLLVHPDFLWNTPLGKSIKNYEYFGYSVNEALFLSEKEEIIINHIIQNIQQEYHSNIDKFSQNIIISQLETLLNYAERFYQRQFITRKITSHQVLDRLEKVL